MLAVLVAVAACGGRTHSGVHVGPAVDVARRQVCPTPEELLAQLRAHPPGDAAVVSVDRFVQLSFRTRTPSCVYPVAGREACDDSGELALRIADFDPTEPASLQCPPPTPATRDRLADELLPGTQCRAFRVVGPGRLEAHGYCIYDATYAGAPPPVPPWLILH